jgi:hypothetical protein
MPLNVFYQTCEGIFIECLASIATNMIACEPLEGCTKIKRIAKNHEKLAWNIPKQLKMNTLQSKEINSHLQHHPKYKPSHPFSYLSPKSYQ